MESLGQTKVSRFRVANICSLSKIKDKKHVYFGTFNSLLENNCQHIIKFPVECLCLPNKGKCCFFCFLGFFLFFWFFGVFSSLCMLGLGPFIFKNVITKVSFTSQKQFFFSIQNIIGATTLRTENHSLPSVLLPLCSGRWGLPNPRNRALAKTRSVHERQGVSKSSRMNLFYSPVFRQQNYYLLKIRKGY